MGFNGTEVAVPATATSIATLLSLPADLSRVCKQLILRLDTAAVNPAYWGEAAVTTTTGRAGVLVNTDTRAVEIGAGDANAINLGDVYLVGTVAPTNIVFVSYVS